MLDPFSSPFQKEQALASRAPVSVLFVCHGNTGFPLMGNV